MKLDRSGAAFWAAADPACAPRRAATLWGAPNGPVGMSVRDIPVRRLGPAGATAASRPLPEETPVALVYHGETLAVMMASPEDLEDLALGFTLSEGIALWPDEVEEIEIVAQETGFEARMALAPDAAARLGDRRRAMAGPVGCGLCGIESLEQAVRPAPKVGPGAALPLDEALRAMEALRAHQPLHDRARALHGAGFWRASAPGAPGRMLLAREDVGRHNALDKLIGAMSDQGVDPAAGAVVLSCRFSVEMAQKCAAAGIGLALAVSAPTAHAVRIAAAAGICVAVPTRGVPGSLDLFGAAGRIGGDSSAPADAAPTDDAPH